MTVEQNKLQHSQTRAFGTAVGAGMLLSAPVTALVAFFAITVATGWQIGPLLAVFGALGYGGVAAGLKQLREARRWSAPSARQLLKRDKRDPILYLRSFVLDEREKIASRVQVKTLGIDLGTYEIGSSREEEGLAAALFEFGPVIAIQSPRHSLPHLGAARLSASDEGWQALVDDLLQRAQLVVISAGFTPGLLWEFERIVSLGDPKRVLVHVPEGYSHVYREFRQVAARLFPRGLPDAVSGAPFILFESDWTPIQISNKNYAFKPGTRASQFTALTARLAKHLGKPANRLARFRNALNADYAATTGLATGFLGTIMLVALIAWSQVSDGDSSSRVASAPPEVLAPDEQVLATYESQAGKRAAEIARNDTATVDGADSLRTWMSAPTNDGRAELHKRLRNLSAVIGRYLQMLDSANDLNARDAAKAVDEVAAIAVASPDSESNLRALGYGIQVLLRQASADTLLSRTRRKISRWQKAIAILDKTSPAVFADSIAVARLGVRVGTLLEAAADEQAPITLDTSRLAGIVIREADRRKALPRAP